MSTGRSRVSAPCRIASPSESLLTKLVDERDHDDPLSTATPDTAMKPTPALMEKWVVFQKWRWPFLHCPSKGIAIDKQANDDVVHLCRFRKADGLADQAFNTRS